MLKFDWFRGLRNRHNGRRLRRPRSGWRQPSYACPAECLEVRTLLTAGNVAVAVANGVVTLTGDSGNHNVAATIVSGKLHLDGTADGTTFTDATHTTGVTTLDVDLPANGLVVTMQGGDDAVSFNASGLASISGNVLVNLGNGTNSLSLTNATITGSTTVDGGSGNDSITLSSDTFGSLAVHAGGGTNSVTLTSDTLNGKTFESIFAGLPTLSNLFTAVQNSVQHVFSLLPSTPLLSSIESTVLNAISTVETTLNNLFSSLPSIAHVAGGVNVGGSLVIDGGSGDDTVGLSSVTGTTSPWTVSLGGGTNSLTMTSVQTKAPLVVSGTTGTDTVTTTGSTFGSTVTVNTGSGSGSQILVHSSTFEAPAYLSTGLSTSPTITVEGSTFQSTATFNEVGTTANPATLNLQSTASGTTTFQGPVFATLGPSATINLGNGASDQVIFESLALFTGNALSPATINVSAAGTTFSPFGLTLTFVNRNNIP